MFTVRPFAEEDENTIKLSRQKPRNKQLNDVLLSRPAGKMRSPTERSRRRDKQELRKILEQDED